MIEQIKYQVALDLNEVTKRIRQIAHPRKIILFGSRARGENQMNSDWDFLVIADSDLPRYKRASPLYGALSDMLAGMDILVYTPDEVNEWRNVPQALVTTAIREGKVLYEKP
ncbi:MAG: nucleotidyltransferase domain-containing protein [Kiritimatiellia bacterium]|nr:nucleotidyltransferase domain-containing protein [Kiritimatiellia bacterium]